MSFSLWDSVDVHPYSEPVEICCVSSTQLLQGMTKRVKVCKISQWLIWLLTSYNVREHTLEAVQVDALSFL